MINKHGLRLGILAASLSVLTGAQPGGPSVAERAKAWNDEIEAMKGQPPQPILDKLLSWKFEPMSAWMTEGPAAKDFKANNIGKAKFTKKEIAEIFGRPGRYKIAVYGLLVGTETATAGEIDELGRTVMKDASMRVNIYTAIRIVFRDEHLISVRTWPKMESSAVAGGTRYIR